METNIRLRLDSSQAKTQLTDLEKQAEGASRVISEKTRSRVQGALRAAGTGLGIGAGIQAVRGAASSGFGDVFGEAFGAIGQQIENRIFGDKVGEARAAQSSRQAVIDAYAYRFGQFGTDGPIPQSLLNGASSLFDQQQALNVPFETGRARILADSTFRGPEILDIIQQIIDGLGQFIIDGLESIGQAIVNALPIPG